MHACVVLAGGTAVTGPGANSELATVLPLLLQVTDPNGGQMHESKAQHQGQFAFTTKVAGEYQACFSTHGAVCAGGRGTC